ncbi:hypothetical protein [Methanohalobium sp.]|uniref:hypothetical protein n=1 Tax=Methanohalobium sp. TaxID=2837493 RepID=UPI0025EB0B3F|nr:hypothetical protein [Methanohalobium sp.]
MSDNGYIANLNNELLVTENSTPDLSVLINTGGAWINGHFYELYSSAEQLAITTPDDSNARIDRAVVRLDLDARIIDVNIKDGNPTSDPSPPSLTRNETIWEISLAQIYVAAGATEITNSDITDERDDGFLCGLSTHSGGGGAFTGDYLQLEVNTSQTGSAQTLVSWDTKNYDTDGNYITVPDTDITIQEAGFYMISPRATIANTVSSTEYTLEGYLKVNGSIIDDDFGYRYEMESDTNDNWTEYRFTINPTALAYLQASDVVRFEVQAEGDYSIETGRFELYQVGAGTI